MRVRIAGDRGFVTIKGLTTGVSQLEFEYPIPLADGTVMLDRRRVRRSASARASVITGSGQDNRQLFSSKHLVNCVLDCDDRVPLGFSLAHFNYFRLAQRHRPFPDAVLDALYDFIFDASMFHR